MSQTSSTSLVYPFHDCCSYIAKTETATQDMDYIIKHRLSGKGHAVQNNAYPANFSSDTREGDGRKILPLFSLLKDPRDTIQRLMSIYNTDMVLFRYKYKIDKNGNVFALCESYKEFQMCC